MRQSLHLREKIAQHALQIRQHVVVPVAHDCDALLCQPLRSTVVSLLALFGMLPTVHFDRKAETRAVEVDRVGADRMLLPKGEAVELVATQCAP